MICSQAWLVETAPCRMLTRPSVSSMRFHATGIRAPPPSTTRLRLSHVLPAPTARDSPQRPRRPTAPPSPNRWGEVSGDDVVAAAMIDRLVHHAEVITLKGDSYRLKDRDLGRTPAARGSKFSRRRQ